MFEKNIIVLTLYGKETTISHISVSLFESEKSAENYRENINEFSLQNGQWVFAQIVDENEKIEPAIPGCMDLKFLNIFNDSGIQWLARNVDDHKWVLALTDIDEDTKEKVFKNMSKRRAKYLQEEMKAIGHIPSEQINEARSEILKFVRKNR